MKLRRGFLSSNFFWSSRLPRIRSTKSPRSNSGKIRCKNSGHNIRDENNENHRGTFVHATFHDPNQLHRVSQKGGHAASALPLCLLFVTLGRTSACGFCVLSQMLLPADGSCGELPARVQQGKPDQHFNGLSHPATTSEFHCYFACSPEHDL